jgi:hypothetical protein
VKNISSLASGVLLGSAGVMMMSVLSGCESPKQEEQNKFLIIEQQANGKYVVVEEMPTEGPSRAIIRERDSNGNVTERFMNEAEMKALAEQEYQKVQSGTSETMQSGNGGMGLAGTILAVAAGSLMGSMIANSLMKNNNFSKRSSSVNKSAYSRSAAAKASSSSKSSRKSFFGGNSRKSSYGSRGFGG